MFYLLVAPQDGEAAVVLLAAALGLADLLGTLVLGQVQNLLGPPLLLDLHTAWTNESTPSPWWLQYNYKPLTTLVSCF